MARTQLLDLLRWDCCLDVNGNIAIADEPYALAQDVASACRTFLGEMTFANNIGVPYLDQILGKQPSNAFVKAQFEIAARTVPGVTDPIAFITGAAGRNLTGQVQFIGPDGQTQTATV